MIHSFTVYLSLNSIWINIIMFKIPTLEPKKHEKISVVFDEGLQRVCYDELKDLVEIGKMLTCPRLFSNILWTVWEHSPEYLTTFPGIFGNIPWNVWGHSLEYLAHSPEYLATFPGMFGNIPQNVWGHSPECLRTFPGMFGDIPWSIWWHSLEYNIPPIPCVPCILFPVPVFLVLYIAVHPNTFWDLTNWKCVIPMFIHIYVKLWYVAPQEVPVLEFHIPNFRKVLWQTQLFTFSN